MKEQNIFSSLVGQPKLHYFILTAEFMMICFVIIKFPSLFINLLILNLEPKSLAHNDPEITETKEKLVGADFLALAKLAQLIPIEVELKMFHAR